MRGIRQRRGAAGGSGERLLRCGQQPPLQLEPENGGFEADEAADFIKFTIKQRSARYLKDEGAHPEEGNSKEKVMKTQVKRLIFALVAGGALDAVASGSEVAVRRNLKRSKRPNRSNKAIGTNDTAKIKQPGNGTYRPICGGGGISLLRSGQETNQRNAGRHGL